MVEVTYTGTIGEAGQIRARYASMQDALKQAALDAENGKFGPDTRLGAVQSIRELDGDDALTSVSVEVIVAGYRDDVEAAEQARQAALEQADQELAAQVAQEVAQ